MKLKISERARGFSSCRQSVKPQEIPSSPEATGAIQGGRGEAGGGYHPGDGKVRCQYCQNRVDFNRCSKGYDVDGISVAKTCDGFSWSLRRIPIFEPRRAWEELFRPKSPVLRDESGGRQLGTGFRGTLIVRRIRGCFEGKEQAKLPGVSTHTNVGVTE